MNDNIILEYKRSDLKLNNLDVVDSDFFINFINEFFNEYKYFGRSENSIDIFNKFKENPADFIKFVRSIITREKDVLQELEEFDDEIRLEYLALIDDIYDFWRNKRRFLILDDVDHGENPQKLILLFNYINSFNENFYRLIYETIYGHYQINYRELPAGFNSGIMTNFKNFDLPKDLSFLSEIKTIEAVVTRPPFMFNTEENTRKGTFFYKDLRITNKEINNDEFVTAMIKVNHKRGLIVLNKKYLYYLPAMANLFQLGMPKENEHIDFVVLFGIDGINEKPYYYLDDGIYVGVLPTISQIDYFGFLKKMILTLFNLYQINLKNLPIHGSAVEINLTNGKSFNICFLGDSGAGKSETLEAIKNLHSPKIRSLKTLFDDMGTFFIINNDVVMSGSEIGAFVRVDDLEKGYPLKSVDRAIYMNIDEINSRTIIPIIDYRSTCHKYHVDYFFLVNNFTDSKVGIERFTDVNYALSEFKKGERNAKGTTDEVGLVSTYFANPFGPLQKKEEVEKYIGNYFSTLFKNNIYVGRLYSKLSIDPKNGPKMAAIALIDELSKH